MQAASLKSMLPIVKNEVRTIRSALWFRPTAFSVLAALIAMSVALVDGYLPVKAFAWFPEVEISTLRDLLNLMAGTMLTVATVTLSVLMLVLSLAAGQASPRAVPEIMADTVTQNALGTFLATFVFALTSLLLLGFGAVAGPGITLTLFCALILIMTSVRYLVQWIHHVAETLKLNRVVSRIHSQAEEVLKYYLDKRHASEAGERRSLREPLMTLHPNRTGYIQLIDEEKIRSVAEEQDISIEVTVQEGDFVHPKRLLLRHEGPELDGATIRALRMAIVIGFERSPEADPRLGFELLTEIACRALSPGVNDPQSALACIEYLGGLLAFAGSCPSQHYPAKHSKDGRVIFARADFAALLVRSVRPIVRDGAGVAEIICAIMSILEELSASVEPEYEGLILEEVRRAETLGLESLQLGLDKQVLTEIAERIKGANSKREDQ
ncbi:DUF2254 domain-containing protein [Denitrobaculum tricleocarpae]|uniref:DUF2254 domain-containing protein n=1 Tax=Denitrobaculum tricleocarpae TaxID=2591009 RepID=A0A545SYQ0_9PROT|nr:DUF2254 domain-containing protein [Denitrobaculum tricleocarpae]